MRLTTKESKVKSTRLVVFRSRMMFVVSRAQVRVGQMRVDLRGGKIAVTEQGLDGARVRAALHQKRGEGMAQRVRRNVRVASGACGVTLNHRPHVLTCERSGAFV